VRAAREKARELPTCCTVADPCAKHLVLLGR
jgi:hypothetical protein